MSNKKSKFAELLHSGQIKYLRVGQVYRIPKLCVIDFPGKETQAAKQVTIASAEEILKGCREMRHPLKAQLQPKSFFYQIFHGTPQGF